MADPTAYIVIAFSNAAEDTSVVELSPPLREKPVLR